jgi:hypothetical protein
MDKYYKQLRGKMKRIFTFLVLTVILVGNTFSQEIDQETDISDFSIGNSLQKQAVYIDLFPMINGLAVGGVGIGIFYEIKLHNYFSVLGETNISGNFQEALMYNIIAHGRVYPFKSTIEKLFFDLGIGYRRRKTEEDNIHSLVGTVKTGWKFILGKGFVLEPGFRIRYNLIKISGNENNDFGINFIIGLGWAF